MADTNSSDKREYHHRLLKGAWDAYHAAYMEFNLKCVFR